ncbi:MAG: hypothetical protein PHN31_00325 [Candidatus Gracilibacteria bacterium]|nr:hypothetical protein [Candidatus Gracilibacteria bacterium]
MKRKLKVILFLVFVIIIILTVFIFSRLNNGINEEQTMLEKTYVISKQYVSLRYQTDNILRNAKTYKYYETWSNEMTVLISKWEQLDKDALELEKLASKISEEKISFNLILKTNAYTKQEISDVFDKAPAGKKIKTLAKFLGVDAKKAFQILKQDQAQVEADTWNEAGNTFQNLETSATILKDYCKVAGFVGGVIVSGGTAGFVGASTLGQVAVVVAGADLTLEVTDDAAKIALGNNNKISEIVGDVRIVTEPFATVLTITNIPGNLDKGIDKFNAVMVALDQFNSAVQDGKAVGIKLPVYTKDNTKQKIEVSILEKNDLEKWIKDQGGTLDKETLEDIENILKNSKSEANKTSDTKENKKSDNTQKEEKSTLNVSNSSVEGVWEGTMKYTPSHDAAEQEMDISIMLEKGGKIVSNKGLDGLTSWKQEGSVVRFYADSSKGEGYYEFSISGETLTFIKLAGPNSEGKWQEDFAGEDFFGGKFYTIILKKQ